MYESGVQGQGRANLFSWHVDSALSHKNGRDHQRRNKGLSCGASSIYVTERPRRNLKTRLRMSSQRKRSWASGVLGVKWRECFRKERVVNSVKSSSARYTKIHVPVPENRMKRENMKLQWLPRVTHLACGRFEIQKPWLFDLNPSS